jgi:hypothetical protein
MWGMQPRKFWFWPRPLRAALDALWRLDKRGPRYDERSLPALQLGLFVAEAVVDLAILADASVLGAADIQAVWIRSLSSREKPTTAKVLVTGHLVLSQSSERPAR